MADTVAGPPEGLYELRLLFDSRDRRHLRRATLIHALDVWHQVELTDLSTARPDSPAGAEAAPEAVLSAAGLPLPGDGGLVRLRLITSVGEVLTGYALFEQLVRRLRLLWPLALLTWVPGLGGLGRWRYPGEPQGPTPPARERDGVQAEAASKGSDHIRARGPARG